MVTLVTTNNEINTTENMFTEADDIALHMEQNRLEAEKKRKASQREAASTLESLTLAAATSADKKASRTCTLRPTERTRSAQNSIALHESTSRNHRLTTFTMSTSLTHLPLFFPPSP